MTTLSFNDLGISKYTVDILTKKGYQIPTDVQAAMIPVFFKSKQDIIARAATGTGKTGAFGIPLIDTMDVSQKHVEAIAIAPTR